MRRCPQATLGPPLVLLAAQRDLSLSHLFPRCRFVLGCWKNPSVTEPGGDRQAGDMGAVELLGGGRAAGTGDGWIRCNRMSQSCSRWTCQLLSVLTPLWVSLNVPLGHRGHHLSHFTRSLGDMGLRSNTVQ